MDRLECPTPLVPAEGQARWQGHNHPPLASGICNSHPLHRCSPLNHLRFLSDHCHSQPSFPKGLFRVLPIDGNLLFFRHVRRLRQLSHVLCLGLVCPYSIFPGHLTTNSCLVRGIYEMGDHAARSKRTLCVLRRLALLQFVNPTIHHQ